VIRGKNEELSKELSKLAAELHESRGESKAKDSQHEVGIARTKNDMTARIENLEKQLTDSAGTVSLLEIDVLREKERADRLQDRLTKEQREKDSALSSLRLEKEGATAKKLTGEREREQLKMGLKITQETLEVRAGRRRKIEVLLVAPSYTPPLNSVSLHLFITCA